MHYRSRLRDTNDSYQNSHTQMATDSGDAVADSVPFPLYRAVRKGMNDEKITFSSDAHGSIHAGRHGDDAPCTSSGCLYH